MGHEDSKPEPQVPDAHDAATEDLFITATQLLEEASPEPEWIIEGLVERGGRTLLAAAPKAGKSTLAFALAGAVVRGGAVLDLEAARASVIYCTEEGSATTLRSKVHRFVSESGDHLHILRLNRVLALSWRETVELIAEAVDRIEAKLVVIDVLHNWARFTESQENDSGATTSALRELDRLTTRGVGVLVLVHTPHGKERPRGSTGIMGDADAIFTLQRPDTDEPVRTLKYLGGRYDDAPERVSFRLDEDGLHRTGTLPARSAAKQEEVLRVLRECGPSTVDEVSERLGVSPSAARARLKKATRSGLLAETQPADNRFPKRWSIASWGDLIDASGVAPGLVATLQ